MEASGKVLAKCGVDDACPLGFICNMDDEKNITACCPVSWNCFSKENMVLSPKWQILNFSFLTKSGSFGPHSIIPTKFGSFYRILQISAYNQWTRDDNVRNLKRDMDMTQNWMIVFIINMEVFCIFGCLGS